MQNPNRGLIAIVFVTIKEFKPGDSPTKKANQQVRLFFNSYVDKKLAD